MAVTLCRNKTALGSGCCTVIPDSHNIRVFRRSIRWRALSILIRQERYKENFLCFLAFVATVYCLIFIGASVFPVIRGITANPRHRGGISTHALRSKRSQVSSELLNHGRE
ncbi:Uncharacterised protein [Shigella sonnei]|nr:Uncharacterised protein [Shigella sonnei]